MRSLTAQKLLQIIYNLEEMIRNIDAKQKILKIRIQNCKSKVNEEIAKEATLALGHELDSINTTITLVEDLHEQMQLN